MSNVTGLVSDKAGIRPHTLGLQGLFCPYRAILLWRVLKGRGPDIDWPQHHGVQRTSECQKGAGGKAGWATRGLPALAEAALFWGTACRVLQGWVPMTSPLLHVCLRFWNGSQGFSRAGIVPCPTLCSALSQLSDVILTHALCGTSSWWSHLIIENPKAPSGRDMPKTWPRVVFLCLSDPY